MGIVLALVVAGCGGSGGAKSESATAFAQRYTVPLQGLLPAETVHTTDESLEKAYSAYERAEGSKNREQSAHNLAEVAATSVIHALEGVTHPTTYQFVQDFNRQLAMLPVQVRIDAGLPLALYVGRVEEAIKNGSVSGQVNEGKVIEGMQARFPELKEREG